ncbi:MAG: hypothetical protein R3F20_00235 [Planctomycetota bacterium]
MPHFRLTAAAGLVALALLTPALSGQMLLESDLFVADRGLMSNGSDGEIRRYNNDGAFVGVLPNTGSGAIRSLAIADDGTIYVARGNQVLRYVSPALTPDTAPVVTGTAAQCVAIHPTTGNLWCSFGQTSSNAQILEVSPTGTILQTVTSALLDQPRDLTFGPDGSTLFVANVAGFNILAVDTAATPPTVVEHADLITFGMNFTPIAITQDPSSADPDLYVVGDYLTTSAVLRVEGVTGSTMVTTAINYASTTDMTAAAGVWLDSWGNLHIACREKNMATPGVYVYRVDSGVRPVLPYLGAEHLSPIDVAFLRRPFDVQIGSDQAGDVFEANGVAGVVIGDGLQPTIRIGIDAPDYPNSPYVVLFSLLTQGQCANGDPVRPQGGGLLITPNEKRLTPLEADTLYGTAQQMLFAAITQGGIIPFPLDPTLNCPQSAPGSSLFLFGVTDAAGHGDAFLSFPTFPAACFPLDFTVNLGFSAAVLDSVTGPLGIGLVSAAPECLRLYLFNN